MRKIITSEQFFKKLKEKEIKFSKKYKKYNKGEMDSQQATDFEKMMIISNNIYLILSKKPISNISKKIERKINKKIFPTDEKKLLLQIKDSLKN